MRFHTYLVKPRKRGGTLSQKERSGKGATKKPSNNTKAPRRATKKSES